MECYDGVEVCELVGFYMLNLLKHDVNKEIIRFYSDNGLGIFPNIPKPELKRRSRNSKNMDYLSPFSAT